MLLSGKRITIFSPEETAHEIMRIKHSAIKNNCRAQNEVKLLHAGQVRYLDVVAEPMHDAQGNIIGITGASLDITSQKLIQQELLEAKLKAEELNRLKSNFLANMSHELRTPLVSILGFTEILKAEIKQPEWQEMISYIHKGGKRLNETLNMILNLSDFKVNKIQLHQTEESILSIVSEVLLEFASETVAKNISLDVVEKVNGITAYLDKRLFTEVLKQIVNNAVKFTNQGGISVEIGKSKSPNFSGEEYLYVKVKDTGIGISEEYHGVIFDEFRQVSEGFARSFEGNGLGLCIAKRMIDLMNGDISVESRLGAGATFTVVIPLISKAESVKSGHLNQRTAQKPSKESVANSRRPRLLHVEDEQMTQLVVKRFLKDVCDIDFVDNGEQALRMIDAQRNNAVLLDMNLGQGMDGIAVVKEIRNNPKLATLPVIAVTAFAMESDEREFREAGCSDYIAKPFEKASFSSKVRDVLERNN